MRKFFARSLFRVHSVRKSTWVVLLATVLVLSVIGVMIRGQNRRGPIIASQHGLGDIPKPHSNSIQLNNDRDLELAHKPKQHIERKDNDAKKFIKKVETTTTLSKEDALSQKPQSKEEEAKERKAGFDNNGFNQWLSDRISMHRNISDVRHENCKKVQFNVDVLPTTSIIIPFHNEARTTLLRTVWTALDRSPPRLIEEIILIDDASTMPHLREPLEREVATIPKVRLLRLPQRSGLIRAKVFGAKHAKGDVLTFLDSHCECNRGWLEPLLQRIHEDRRNVVTPTIDNIDRETFKYSGAAVVLTRGIFTWPLTFSWLDLPYDEAQKRTNPADPLPSPTMAGGLFSMDREYFFEIGSYDMGMEVWGGENLEISFRIWMCGGRLEVLPCSHVGHVFRLHHPYKFPNGTGQTINRNLNRVAEVWLDDYKEIYYHFRPHHRSIPTGDISDRVQLRQDLKCKSFKWYLDNVFPDMMVPLRENLHAHGRLENSASQLCLDSKSANLADMEPILVRCAQNLQENQEYFFTKKLNEIRREANFGNRCLDFAGGPPLSKPTFYGCHSMRGNQEWFHLPSKQIRHVPSKMCLEARPGPKPELVMNTCDENNQHQIWQFSEYDQYHG